MEEYLDVPKEWKAARRELKRLGMPHNITYVSLRQLYRDNPGLDMAGVIETMEERVLMLPVIKVVTAVHEAGHAVVSAFLKVPFEYVATTFEIIKDEGGSVAARGLRTYWPSRGREINFAIMVLGARAAVDMFATAAKFDAEDKTTFIEESQFAGDEDDLQALAGPIAEGDFVAWRSGLLKRAQDIVAIPYVTKAIFRTAKRLGEGEHLSYADVRRILRTSKAKALAAAAGK